MNTQQMPQSASEWYVALREMPEDAALRRAHDRWLSASEANRRDWEETLRVSDLMSMTAPAHSEEWGHARRTAPPEAARTGTERRGRRPRPQEPAARPARRRRRRRIASGVGVAAAICLAVVLLPDAMTDLQADHSSATGEVKLVELQDGSRIQLAPESAVALEFGPSSRRVALLKGQAFFDVATDRGRPFRVRAANAETEVLGTRFDVALSGPDARIAVEEGSVRVRYAPGSDIPAAGGAVLSPGDVLRVAPDGTTTAATIPPSLIAAWRSGRLVAQNQPLGELVAVLDRYFDGWIVIADPSLGRQPLTGIYSLADPEAALRAMAEAQGATVREISPWVLVLSGG